MITRLKLICLFTVAAVSVVGCTSSGDPEPTPHVRVLGLWSGPEFDSFDAVKSAWEKDTGGVVDWEATQNLPDALESGAKADIVVLPSLGLMRELAEKGGLVPLDSVLDTGQVAKDYAPSWLDLGSHGGKLYGIFYKVTDKATVWYNPKAFAAAHYQVPRTWKDMITLADTMVADGRTPFSVVGPSGPANGWALTDWVSEIVLNNCGPSVYDQWIAAEIPWTAPCVKQSFGLFSDVIRTKGYVLGGSRRIRATTDADGGNPLYTDPPEAYLYYLASFAQGFIASSHPELEPGSDYHFFTFPTVNPRYSGAVTIGADVLTMVNDTPTARSFLKYLAGAEAQEAWIKLGGFTSVNRSVSASAYADPVGRAVAEELTKADVTRFSAGDMMPASLQRAWWRGMLELVEDPSTLDSMLSSLTRAAQRAK